MIARPSSRTEVSVTETGFGYVVRSRQSRIGTALCERLLRFLPVPVWIAAIGIWLVPFGGTGILPKLAMSVGLLAVVYTPIILFCRRGRGIELQVDTARRELRSAVVSPDGERRLQGRARFGEVTSAIVQRSKLETAPRCLGLRIAGSTDPMPVAVGGKATLLAVHDRLMRDLRPIEEKLASYRLASGRHPAFSPLAPDEVIV